MNFRLLAVVCSITFALIGPTAGHAADEAGAPAWSVNHVPDRLIIAVSPARQSLQIAGSTGALIGASIDTVANDKYRKAIMEALEGYDSGAVFEQRLGDSLSAALGTELKQVAPVGSAAGYNSVQEAADERHAGLYKNGSGTVLDLKISYGLFGMEGLLLAKISGIQRELPSGKKVWKETIVAVAEPVLASVKLADPSNRTAPNFSSPRLSAGDDVIVQWTANGGAVFRERYESTVDDAIAGLLQGLGLEESSLGAYTFGKSILNKKKFEKAEALFKESIAMDASNVDANNALAVCYMHQKRIDDSVALLTQITKTNPEYGPGWHNLAWVLAMKVKDTDAAKVAYKKSLDLGMPKVKKLDKRLK